MYLPIKKYYPKLESIGMMDHYKDYLKENPKGSANYVDLYTFRTICNEFNSDMIAGLIYEGKEFRMPFRLGSLEIRRSHTKNFKPVNFNSKENENELEVQHNINTLGYIYYFYWRIPKTVAKRKMLDFKVSRYNTRLLASEIKNNYLTLNY